jgi:hypothetical protein
MVKNSIQKQIEMIVTSGRGYIKRNFPIYPIYLRGTEMELQHALSNMDYLDGKITQRETNKFSKNFVSLVLKLNNAGLSAKIITSPEGLKTALDFIAEDTI